MPDILVERTEPTKTLTFRGRGVDDEIVRSELSLPDSQFCTLIFTNTSLTDMGFLEISPRPELENLVIVNAYITDKAIVDLSQRFSNLRNLRICDCRVGDSVVDSVISLHGLESLYLDGTEIHGESLEKLEELTRLRDLYLTRNPIGDAVAKLAKLSGIRRLGLSYTCINDHNTISLTHLKDIVLLRVGGNEITDESVENLASLPKLSYLDVSFTKISESGIRTLLKCENLSDIDVEGLNLRGIVRSCVLE